MDPNTNALSSGLPPEAHLFDHQLAGHKHVKGGSKPGMLKHDNGNILKPLFKDVRSQRELLFYEQIFGDESNTINIQLKQFLPEFHGTWIGKVNNKDVKFLCLEDITSVFKKPSILDIKIGAITYDPEATKEKIEYEDSKNAQVKILGFRILGMRIYDNSEKTYLSFDKQFGKELSVETTPDALKLYLSDHDDFISCCILSGFLHRLHKIEEWFSVQKLYSFYSSSLLFAYEGNSSTWTSWKEKYTNSHCYLFCTKSKNNCLLETHNFTETCPVSHENCCNEMKNICNICCLSSYMCGFVQSDCSLFSVSMIDFAHVFPSSQEDKNYIFGLRSVIKQFQTLCQNYAKSIAS